MSSSREQNERSSDMHSLMRSLLPICRSITGDGVRQTLAQLQAIVPLTIHEIPSGTPVFDWTIPPEWNIREAWIKDPSGKLVVDFRDHNLHVVSYSLPVRAKLTRSQLDPHLHSLPNRPNAIPYRTTYYKRDWGFCLSHTTRESLPDGEYEVCIDSDLKAGQLTYGELVLPGETEDEILISAHVCHPSMANDNLSGIVVAVELAKAWMRLTSRKLGVRFLWMPGTIGAIAWLAQHENDLHRIRHGLILSGVGDSSSIHYKRSRMGNARIDRVMERVLRSRGGDDCISDFVPYGYDERQYCSPGINLAVGCLSRSPFGTYPEYHTSDDNIDFISTESLLDTLDVVMQVVDRLQTDKIYVATNPRCEPQLGKRGLYDRMEDDSDAMGMFWILNMSDGNHSLEDIADLASLPMEQIDRISQTLLEHGLLK